MLRDVKFFRRNSGKIPQSEGSENIPLDSSSTPQLDPNRPPLSAIQETVRNPKLGGDQETILRRKIERTPSKSQTRAVLDAQFRTPERPAASKNRFGWVPKSEPGSNSVDSEGQSQLPPLSRGLSSGNGGGYNVGTPRTYRTGGKVSSVHSDCSSTQSTPTKSVNKPTYSGFGSSRPPMSVGRTVNYAVASKGMPMSVPAPSVYIAAEVPHFELREDPSFWMENNVQVVIRVRPINIMEQSMHGYSRCLKQESAQSITWIGHAESRFTFDYVACETISQEMLFRVAGLPMVENCMSGYNSCMFAYGQTGSGKTHTMLGEIGELELRPSADRGMTPRIFEFLFARIKAEEESRRDEKLKYNCKCSFLEIYNEQITDLLDPSSTNLFLREDIHKGVYVENLAEFEVETVNDILKLLFQGAANRKVAATNMNRESSRSHSVFTCVIESRWEKDSTTNLRFARLNLVDLAGSERQKTSGAEGERLKEAASINKSLSTLGHVILVLADVAHGKQRHVPYRDSRLTFLLQDSLGGNSKTMIIANVSPSIWSANETLSTLKFAQRARLVQNNAVVNEDASGDISALQRQIRLLKEELSLLKRQNVSRSLSFRAAVIENSKDEDHDASLMEDLHGFAQLSVDELNTIESCESVRVSTNKLKSLETTLAGALRREKMADTTITQLETEIEQLNRLVRHREEDTRNSRMMLKFREDKIHRMEALLDDHLPPDSYLLEENKAQSEEIQLLQARADKNPEVTRFAWENIRLREQLRRFQDFYEEGERELLLTEVSELRNQLILILDGKTEHDHQSKSNLNHQEDSHPEFAGSISDHESLYIELKDTSQELEQCKDKLNSCLETNARLITEINNLHVELTNIKSACHSQHINDDTENMDLCLDSPHSYPLPTYSLVNHDEEILNLQLELDILKTILGEEKLARFVLEKKAIEAENEFKAANERISQYEGIENELKDARSIIEALESQHILSINELEELREINNQFLELLKKREKEIVILKKQICSISVEEKLPSACRMLKNQALHTENEDSPLQEKLRRMQASLEKARSLNTRFQSDQASNSSLEQEKDEVRTQVEVETAEVIMCLQEELITLQQMVDVSNRNEVLARESLLILETELKDVNERFSVVTQENEKLGEMLEEKEKKLRPLSADWEKLAYEIAEVLADGNVALESASDQIASISDSFPCSWVTEQVGKIIRNISEKDLLIEELHKCLEEAQNVKCDLEWKVRSLRGATLAITEAQQQESCDNEREIHQLTSQLSQKMSIITKLEDNIRLGEERLRQAGICATVAFTIVNRLSEINAAHLEALKNVKFQLNESSETLKQKDALLEDHLLFQVDIENQMQAMKAQVEQFQEQTHTLLIQLEKSQVDQPLAHQQKGEVEDVNFFGDDLLEVKQKVGEFKMGVSTLRSCMSEYAEQVTCPADEFIEGLDNGSEHRIGIESNTDTASNEQHDIASASGGRIKIIESKRKSEYRLLSQDMLDRETTSVLRRELESALDSLMGVQAQMVKLHDEKEEIKQSEIQSQKHIEYLTAEVLQLKSAIIDKEHQFELRLLELEEKLQGVEGSTVSSNACWQKIKEELDLEISNAKSIATQKTIEASNLLTKIKEVQETMWDADITVNALMEANETIKLEVERYKTIEITLNHEKNNLVSEVHTLHSSLDVKEQEYESLKKNFLASLTEGRSLFLALEDNFRLLQGTFAEKFKLIECELDWLKAQLQNHTHLVRAWLEEIWSEIIGKDCAMSVLHLCHMGILLERITGLNAENGFLYHGLSESNSVIADLKKHNSKAKRELELCSILKGKLLVDINNSFNRITKKEVETTEFKARINSFEEKIVHLQLQEKTMLDRSNSMGTELSILMKELDASNRNVSTAISAQEKHLREKEELKYQLEKALKLLEEVKSINVTMTGLLYEELDLLVLDSQSDTSVKLCDPNVSDMLLDKVADFCKIIKCRNEAAIMNMYAKDFELFILAAELRQTVSQKLDMERQRNTFSNAMEKLKEDFILNQIDMELRNGDMHSLLVENEILKDELLKVKEENSIAIGYLQEQKLRFASTLEHVSIADEEIFKLQDMLWSSQACTARLQADMDKKCEELALILKELELKNEANEIQIKRTHAAQMENGHLENELMEFNQKKDDYIAMAIFKLKHCYDLTESVDRTIDRMFYVTGNQIFLLNDRICLETSEHKEMASKFVDELEFLELSAKELMLQNFSLQSELMRKDELSKGLSFDLRLLQESASEAKDQKDKLEAVLESLEGKFTSKSCELDEANSQRGLLEAQLLVKNERIAVLELELAEKQSAANLVFSENLELKAHMEHIIETRDAIEEELSEKNKVTEKLEDELLEMRNLLGQRNHVLENFQDDTNKLADERVRLENQMLILKEQMEMAQALAEENEAIATEARQIAEERKVCAADREEEIRLLERSVEELECTVNALENKVDFVRGEAERQRLQREELETELEAVRHQMLTLPSSGSNIWKVTEERNLDFARHLEEKVTELQASQQNILVLQKEVADKDAEIVQCKAHISELNMHADAQAREYKQRFKELEIMAQQVKVDTVSSNATNLTSTKAEKSAVKSRGSGSPFKCIGLGLAQQINSEKNEELDVARLRIEELEALAASRQKEIFMLNTRLAAAESMTHDVIRDLLGVKLDMTSYAALFNRDQMQTTQFGDQEYQEKDQLIPKLKKQLSKFVEERESWLDEINRRHTELVSVRIALEKLQQREQFLTTENGMLKVDNAKFKKAVMELEDEVRKLTDQQNLHQRIHHHVKIKEENKSLRSQNEDLHTKLEKSESILSRLREELARYRAACGKKPFVDTDEEEHLRRNLVDNEEERAQLEQKLLTLCTCILKVAGLSTPPSSMSPSAAEEALCQIKERISSLESEVQDLKLKCKLFCEKIRLCELREHQSSMKLTISHSLSSPRPHVSHHDEAVERR